MNKIYYLVLTVLILIIVFLSKSIFFGENNYSKRANLIEENKMQKIMNLHREYGWILFSGALDPCKMIFLKFPTIPEGFQQQMPTFRT